VWVAISNHEIIRQLFFDVTINSGHVALQLIATGLLINTQWFMQDGARPHTANVVLDFLLKPLVP
jgi:hypothetical protein